ncbi:BBP7 family outer membrane beta-barrel protein [Zavarzinella formosa]|uniref:BBP7 family outer membrane beta-barrel protein n=1 Tax=Zavarzinella formosa TaxID=360055 RepID=UPI0003123FB7|nr:BBP7 family outer membrane beta-barrel protein [Zavarzinella formosa]
MNPRMLALVLAVGVGSASAGDPEPKPKDAKPETIPAKQPDAVPAPKPILPDVDKLGAVSDPIKKVESSADKILPETPLPIVTLRNDVGGPTWWVAADYLMWWTKGMPVNSPYVTTGSQSDPFAGSLDRPSTRVLYGDKSIDFGVRSGLRLQTGMWFDNEATFGAELVGFMLEQGGETATFSGGSNGQPFFGIPFVNARTGQPNIYFVSQNFNDPAVSASLTGALDISTKSRFWAYEINGLVNLYRSSDSWVVGLMGFRSMGLDESIRFTESLRSLIPGGSVTFGGATVDPSQSVGTIDDFKTTNRFYGPQVGTRVGTILGGFFMSAYASVALGVNEQERNIDGSTLLMSGGRTLATLPGGVFAVSSNIGRTSQSDFSVVPEAGLSLGYQFTPWLSARFGYNFVYWNNVQRATQQVDATINPGLVPSDVSYGTPGGPNRPGAIVRTSDFWAQGINFGIEIKR